MGVDGIGRERPRVEPRERDASANRTNRTPLSPQNIVGESRDGRAAQFRWGGNFFRESLFRSSQFVAFNQPASSRTTLPANHSRAELEQRAQHIFDRFRDDGFLNFSSETSFSEIADDLAGLTPADVETLKQIYAARFSPQREGRDLITDLQRELNNPYDRFRAMQVLSPQSIQTQFYPASEPGRLPSIISDPPVSEIVPGTNITYGFHRGDSISSGPPEVRSFIINDPATTPEGYSPVVYGGDDGKMEAEAAFAGRHQVVFEVRHEGAPPEYYTYNQIVRDAPDAARRALFRMPGPTSEPELYLGWVDQQISATEQQVNQLRAENSPLNEDRIKQLDEMLGQLREVRKEMPSKLRDGAIASAIPMQAVLIPKETSQTIPLQVYAKPLANNRWAIVDATNPTEARTYEGSGATPEEAIRNAWNEFINSNNLPEGQIAAVPPRIPPGYRAPAGFPPRLNFSPQEVWNNRSDGESDFQRWSSNLGWFSLGAAIVGGVLLFVPGGQPFALGAFGIAGAAGAASGGLNIYDRAHYGNFEWWSAETALDMLSIVGGVASAGGGVAGLTGLLRAGSATATLADGTAVTLRQVDRLGRFVSITSGVDQGSNLAGGIIIGAVYLHQIEQINSNPNLTAEQKRQQTEGVLNQAVLFGGIVVVGHGLGGRASRIDATELEGLLARANFRADLAAQVRQSPGLQRALQEQGAERLRELYDTYLSRQSSLRVQSFEEYVWRNGISTRTDRVPTPLNQALNNNFERMTSREVNEAILARYNSELLDAMHSRHLPPNAEAALSRVLDRNFNFDPALDFSKARAALSKEINAALGQSIENVDELRQVLGFMQGSNRSATSGSIGDYYYRTRLSQGTQLEQPEFARELYVADPTRSPDIRTRRPDYLLTGSRRTLDVKTGYENGDFDLDQLLDYNDLVKASRNPNNTELQALLRQRGINGGLTGHDYLFLPNGNSSAEEAARRAYQSIRRQLPQEYQNFGVYYLADDGNIYKYLGLDGQGRDITRRVGPQLPN